MTTCTSPGCAAPTADGIHLCDPHEGDLWRLLGQIPDTLTDAEDTVARLDARRDIGRSGATPGAPINLEASQRVTELTDLLVSWSRLLYDATGEAGDAGADYLRAHLREIVRHDWAGDMLSELGRAHRRLVQAVDVPPDWRTYGPCHIEDCAGLIRGKAGDVLARCRACGEPYDATLLRAYNMTRADEYRVTLNEVAELMAGLPGAPSRRTIYNWAESGKLPTEGEGAARTCKPSDAVYLLERGRVDAAA